MEQNKCPECGEEDFLVIIKAQIELNTERNFGNITYDWVEKIGCANILCNHVVKEEPLRTMLLNQLKRILKTLKSKTLIIK